MNVDFAVLFVVGLSIAIVAVVLRFVAYRHAKRSNHSKWQPALSPEADAHSLGTELPQRSGTFLSGLVHKRYTVPKDPQAYAKIFVPDSKD